jgi:hypothetical protein
MDQQFIKDALRTESRIDVVKFNHLTLLRAFNAVELSTNILDAVKKSVFYAKPLPNTLEGDLTRLSIATHKLQHYLTEGTFNAPEHQEIIDIVVELKKVKLIEYDKTKLYSIVQETKFGSIFLNFANDLPISKSLWVAHNSLLPSVPWLRYPPL